MKPLAMIRRFSLVFTAVLLATLLFAAHGRAQEDDPWRFGVIEAYTAPNAARDLPAAWTRVTLQWADVQAGGPDTWTPAISDEQLVAQEQDGRDVIGLLIGIPDWARDEDKLPAGLWLPHTDPGNTWANFVREATSRYAGQIDHWIIWNEPDIDATAVAHTWDGTVDDFYQLQRVAYLVAKETNSDAVIHLPAFTYWADVSAGREQTMARLLDRILTDPEAAQHNFYFDVATAHLYFQADQIYELLLYFRGLLAERGLTRPIWLVETNAPPYNDPSWPVETVALAVTENEQAAFMGQGLAAALAGGAERIGVFKLRDTETDRQANPEPFGLLRLDGSRRPAFATYKVAIAQMTGVQHAARLRWDEVGQFELQQTDRRTTVLFARLPVNQWSEVPALAPTARLVNMWGEEEIIEAENGRYRIELQSALCTQTIGDYCMIGGTTLYLIEALDGGPPPQGPAPALPPPQVPPTLPPTATLPASATPPPTSTPLPSVTPSPTAAASPTLTVVPSLTPTAAAEPSPGSAATFAPASPAPVEVQAGSDPPLQFLLLLVAVLGLIALAYWLARHAK